MTGKMTIEQSFRAYLDESEDAASGLYVVGGFCGEAGVWDDLEREWVKQLPRDIPWFHATDCFTGNKHFKGMEISRRTALLDALTDVIAARRVKLIGYGIDAKTYAGLAPKAKQNDFLENKYAAPFGGVVQLACECMGQIPGPDEIWDVLEKGDNAGQCAFFIESNEYSASANRTIAAMRTSQDLWWRNRIGTETYGVKAGPAGIPLLQVADLGAFLATKRIANAPVGKVPWKTFYDKLEIAKRVYRLVHADESSLHKLHRTHEELKREAAEGKCYWDDI